MREIPLLMNGPMVRATLAGHKTNTRREIIRLGGFGKITQFGRSDTPGYDWHFRDSAMRWHDLRHPELLKACPYGQPGDLLWVRETWAPDLPADGTWAYTSWAGCRDSKLTDIPERYRKPDHCMFAADYPHDAKHWIWKPSIHMPRWACRILLEITGVRVERTPDISQADAYAEGAMSWAQEQETPIKDLNGGDDRMAFMALWESIGGTGSWDANPWVWVIEFRGVK